MDTTRQTFETIDPASAVEEAQALLDGGWRFSQLCGRAVDGGVEVMYTFEQGIEMRNLLAASPNGAAIPSITSVFPAAFVFENELQDLFGLKVEGISVDYGGRMYRLAASSPMNPAASKAPDEPSADGAPAEEGGVDGN